MSWTQKSLGEVLGPTIKRAVQNYWEVNKFYQRQGKYFEWGKRIDYGYSSWKRDTIAVLKIVNGMMVRYFSKFLAIEELGKKWLKHQATDLY